MTATSTAPPRSSTAHLGRRARRAALLMHVVSAGAWIGMDVVLAVFVFTALFTADAQVAAVSLRALELFAIGPLLAAGVVCLVSGLTLGWGTKYGLLRYWWVAAKLAINVVFVALVVLALRPQVLAAAERGRALSEQGAADAVVGELVFPAVVSPLGLLAATVLAVYKPWGRIGARRRRRARAVTPGAQP
ncbi:hypothetical protein [Salinifilum ghardaiensis]